MVTSSALSLLPSPNNASVYQAEISIHIPSSDEAANSITNHPPTILEQPTLRKEINDFLFFRYF
jgi:hypothetical protein